MKKIGQKKTSGNVILFPDLEKRLLDRGLERLQQKNFNEAIRLFEEAKALTTEDENVYIGLVLAYYESGALTKARELAKEMLKEGIGDYFQTVDLYLMILVQLNEFDEIITTIEVLQEEREIPFEKQEHFFKLLTFSQRMKENSFNHENEDLDDEFDDSKQLKLFESNDPNKQVLAIAELAQRNVRPYIEEIVSYLRDEEGHPFLKTSLCNILQDQQYDEEVTIAKFAREKIFVPSKVESFQENQQMNRIRKELIHIESSDPTLYQQMISLLERHFFLLFPFELEPANPDLWAAAYHLISLQYNGVDITSQEITKKYPVDPGAVEKAVVFITKLEEISYPII